MFATMSEADARRRLSEITQFPHHPERMVLERELAKAASGPEVSEFWVWIDRNGDTRFSTTTTWPDGTITTDDTVVSSSARWQMTGSTRDRGVLIVLDPSVAPPPDRDLQARIGSGTDAIAALANCALARPSFATFVPEGVRQSEGRTFGSAKRGVSELSVELEHDGGTLRPIAVTLGTTTTGRTALRYRVSGWHMDETLGSQIARSWERVGPDGAVLESIRLIEIRPLTEEEFASLATIPNPSGADKFRGPSTYSVVWDYRPDAGTYTVHQNGNSTTTPIPPSAIGASLPRSWNRTGPVLAGAVLTGLCVFRWWRRRQPTST